MPVSEQTYIQVALEDHDGKWELHCGGLVSKPPMSIEHNLTARNLHAILFVQLDRAEWEIVVDQARASRLGSTYYIPDLFVVPRAAMLRLLRTPHALEAYSEPLPLVVEVWSSSTGRYDIDAKLPEYRRRGDREIWRAHPYERTVRIWRRQPDGSYSETLVTGGVIELSALPGVRVDLDRLFTFA